MVLVSVAHPKENILFGDYMIQAKAALRRVTNQSNEALGNTIGIILLVRRSQGGYWVTRLNTRHQPNGVIASAPGPLDLVYGSNLGGKRTSASQRPRLQVKECLWLGFNYFGGLLREVLVEFYKGI